MLKRLLFLYQQPAKKLLPRLIFCLFVLYLANALFASFFKQTFLVCDVCVAFRDYPIKAASLLLGLFLVATVSVIYIYNIALQKDHLAVCVIKVFLIILLAMCLLDMPYKYYEVLRLVTIVSLPVLAASAVDQSRMREGIIWASLILLFQPIWKVPISKDIWQMIDLVAASGLVLSLARGIRKESVPSVIYGSHKSQLD